MSERHVSHVGVMYGAAFGCFPSKCLSMNLLLGVFIKWPGAKDNSRQRSKQGTGSREEEMRGVSLSTFQGYQILSASSLVLVKRPDKYAISCTVLI